MRWPKIILHADMDAFYAAVEQRDRPELRGKPVLIGHPSGRSVVLTASYEARPFGVGSAMPMARARRLCPQALVVLPRMDRYAEVSSQVMDVFHDFSPKVEALSLDEAFLDMTGAEGVLGTPEEMGQKLRAAVREKLGLAVSVGISGTKYVAKVASDSAKPDGLCVVPPDEARAFLAPLPVRRLWGIGPKTEPRLHDAGLRTIGDVAASSPSYLTARLGSLGAHIHALSVADDLREVVPDRDARSIGWERTLVKDIQGEAAISPLLLEAADEVARRLRSHQLVARGVRVKLKTASFHIHTRQLTLQEPTDSASPIVDAARSLLPAFDHAEPVRLVGISAFAMEDAGKPRQGELFAAPTDQRRRTLDRTLDAVAERFGKRAVHRASDEE